MLLQTDLPQMEADAVAALLGAKSADPVEPVATGATVFCLCHCAGADCHCAGVELLGLLATVLVLLCWCCHR